MRRFHRNGFKFQLIAECFCRTGKANAEDVRISRYKRYAKQDTRLNKLLNDENFSGIIPSLLRSSSCIQWLTASSLVDRRPVILS